MTAGTIIEDAHYLIGALEEGEVISGEATTTSLRMLNNIVKSWMTQGYHRFLKQEVVIPLIAGQARYLLGNASTDAHWADENDFFTTQLNGALVAGDSSLTVDSSSDMAKSDFIGIELSDGTRQWTTIKTVSSSTIVTTNAVLTGAASDNATVYTYTTRPTRPLRILHARRRASATGSDIEVFKIADEEYQSQPQKNTNGTPVSYNYKPLLVSGDLRVWQPPNDAKMFMRCTVEKQVVGFATVSSTGDFPDEWTQALTYSLAHALEPQFAVLDISRRNNLRDMAMMYLEQVKTFDMDTGSVRFRPRKWS